MAKTDLTKTRAPKLGKGKDNKSLIEEGLSKGRRGAAKPAKAIAPFGKGKKK